MAQLLQGTKHTARFTIHVINEDGTQECHDNVEILIESAIKSWFETYPETPVKEVTKIWIETIKKDGKS